VVERRTTIPILSNILLTARDGGLSLTGTDMDLAVVETAPADVAQPGTTTVAAHTFYDIVRKLPDGAQIDIATGGEQGQLILKCGRSRLSLSTLPSDDFPVATDGDLPHKFTVGAEELKTMVDRTRFAISTEETRFYLNGIYLHAAAGNGTGKLRAVATDGHRLARFEMPLPAGADKMPGIIVPRKAVGELRKLLDQATGEVAVALSDTRIRFGFDNVVLSTKLIDGTFPDYERVIPLNNDKVLTVSRDSFANAVDLVSTISTEKSRAVKLKISKDNLELSAASPDSGTATEELPVEYAASPMEIGFNSRYLLDIAEQIKGENAEFVLADAASPTIVRDAGDSAALYVLMPMRV
jgi:DNA polymerase-3 subunit beta